MTNGKRISAWLREARPTFALALPIMSGMLSHTLIGLVDTIMVGRLGVTPLAAASLVNVLIHPALVFAVGLLSAVAVLSSQAFGAGRPADCGQALRNGLVASLLVGLLQAIGWHFLVPYLYLFGQDAAVVEASRTYLLIFAWSIIPALMAHACKQFCESLNQAWIPNAILLGSVVLTAFFNWLLIYGHWGAPQMGLEGAGWATLFARLICFVMLFAYVLGQREFAAYLPARWLAKILWPQMREMWRVGGPVALQHLCEVGAFVFAAIMMGWISAEALAAHQIAITCAATTFMLAFGVGMASCIRVGHAWGAGNFHLVRRIGFGGIVMGGSIMGVCGFIFMLGRHPIANLFVQAPLVVQITVQLFIVAALFQLADGIQITAICALRGIADVRIPALVAVLAYWVVAIPIAYFLGFHTTLGATGIWIGLALGLGVAAVFLSWRFHHITREKHLTEKFAANTEALAA